MFTFQGEPGRHGKDGLMGIPGYKVFTKRTKKISEFMNEHQKNVPLADFLTYDTGVKLTS